MPKGYLADGTPSWKRRNPVGQGRPPRPREDLFWSHVDREGRGGDECWPWKGGVTRQGYGRFWNRRAASRIALELIGIEFGTGEQANHTCGNRLCCNPAHIYVGTQKDNMRDRDEDTFGTKSVANLEEWERRRQQSKDTS